ncbi:MAG: ABC transporter permease [Candidatus Acidiferrales bacterium]|jgi:predicted permease
MGALWQDVRYALRMLLKSPAFTATAILTLALGIGANSTIFSWINSTLLNPIPGAANTGNILAFTSGGDSRNPIPFSYLDFLDLRERTKSFSAITGFSIEPMNLTGKARPERIWGTLVSANYFDFLGVRPILGRGFLQTEDNAAGGAPVVVISYRMWQLRYAGDRSVIGRTLQINEHPYTIVGVAPHVFQGTQTGLRSELWLPIMMAPQIMSNSDRLHERSNTWVVTLGRLAPGVLPDQAQAEMNLLMKQLVAQFPKEHQGENVVTLYPMWRAPFGANGYLYVLLPMLMAIAGAVLLLACANVANLLLVRSVARRREIAIRLSIGASRWRLVRQLLIESLILALAGGGVAMLITTWTAGTFSQFIPPTNIPVAMDIHADSRVLVATMLLSLFTGIIFGVLPAWRASDLAPIAVLKEDSGSVSGGLHRARLASILVVAQISLSLFLLVCAGLFIRSFRAAQTLNPGFNPDHVLIASYSLFPSGYNRDSGVQFHRQLLDKIAALPGVQSVSIADWVPLGYSWDVTTTNPEGYVPQPHESMNIATATVGPNYMRTMQIPLVAGRDFSEQDTTTSQPVAVVNEAFVQRYWPNQEGVGKRVHAQSEWRTVVGVTHNASYFSLRENSLPFIYLPVLQNYSDEVAIHARVAGDPLRYTAAVEKAVHELNANLPVYDESTLASRVQVASTGQRIAGTFVGAFGLLALVLAAVGIYGVIAYTTRQRTHEIGLRMALGAQSTDVFRMVLGNGLRLILTGLACGLVLSLALTRFLRTVLFGVGATDFITFAVVGLLLSVVALLACYIPARRAMRVDPMVALRYE